jgi:hypothetical protein
MIVFTHPRLKIKMSERLRTESYQPNDVRGVSSTKAESGQSFVSENGSSWDDFDSDGTSNLRVKAFTINEKNSSNANTYIAIFLVASLVVAITAIAVLVRKH